MTPHRAAYLQGMIGRVAPNMAKLYRRQLSESGYGASQRSPKHSAATNAGINASPSRPGRSGSRPPWRISHTCAHRPREVRQQLRKFTGPLLWRAAKS